MGYKRLKMALIKTSKKINKDKEKVSAILHKNYKGQEGITVEDFEMPTRLNIDTHNAELFINPNTKELYYEYTEKTQEELQQEEAA